MTIEMKTEEFRRDIPAVMRLVSRGGASVIVKKHNRPLCRIVPIDIPDALVPDLLARAPSVMA